MPNAASERLADFIEREREALLARWRGQVKQLPSAKHLDLPTLNDHIPLLLTELVAALRADCKDSTPAQIGSSPAHGLQRVEDGFDIEEMVAEYNILRACIHDLAEENDMPLLGKTLHIVNLILDGATGAAVQTFAMQKALEVQKRREEYLAFVAHDLRTPLNAISLAGRVLEHAFQSHPGSAETLQMLKSMRRNVQQLESLVQKVVEENTNLETESGIKLERRDFDLWPLVESLIHDLHPIAGTGSTRLVNNIPHDLVVNADASLLRRVFQNLIANAIHYAPRGEVIVEARQLPGAKGIECLVRDNGSGIPTERLGKVFDKGETNAAREGGTGLGLAIVKTFVEAHSGTVAVENNDGAGSTFRFSLPNPT